jgi:hypothetical protein
VYRDPDFRFRAVLQPDGRVTFKNLVGTPKKGMPGMSEAVRAAQDKDLYYREKKQLLDDTFDLRLSMAVEYASKQVDRQLRSLQGELAEAWGDVQQPAKARRRLLFDRWDECEEGVAVKLPGFEDEAGTRMDALRQDAGSRARASIEAFIRKHLPRGSPDAYAASEIAELNRIRHSRKKFDPYGG